MKSKHLEDNLSVLRLEIITKDITFLFREDDVDKNGFASRSYNFKAARKAYSKLIKLIEDLLIILRDIDEINNEDGERIIAFFNSFNAFVEKVQKFNTEQYISKLSDIIGEFIRFNNEATKIESDILKPLINNRDNVDFISKYNEERNKKNEEINANLSESTVLLNSLKEQVDYIRENSEDYLTKIETLRQSDIFLKSAIRNRYSAIFWGVMIIGSLISLICLINHIKENFCFDIQCYYPINLSEYNEICDECGKNVLWYELLKSLFFRVLIISINLYALSFSVKNFNASMHNYTVNKHRENSLSAAFYIFNNTTSNHKDDILSKAADAIFTYQKTGYYGKEATPSNPTIIQKVVENFTGSNKE